MPRGGRRKATPGKAYANRTDLAERRPLPPAAGPSKGYGQRTAQIQAQQAVPMAPAPAPSTEPVAPPAPAGPAPGEFGDPFRPTERPGEPLTSGIPSGDGPGPEALGLAGGPGDYTVDELRALYMAHPNEDLRQLIEDDDEGVLL